MLREPRWLSRRLISRLRADVNIQLTVPTTVPVDNIENFAVPQQPHSHHGPAILAATLHLFFDDRPSDLFDRSEVETMQFRFLSDAPFHAQEKGHCLFSDRTKRKILKKAMAKVITVGLIITAIVHPNRTSNSRISAMSLSIIYSSSHWKLG